MIVIAIGVALYFSYFSIALYVIRQNASCLGERDQTYLAFEQTGLVAGHLPEILIVKLVIYGRTVTISN